MNANELTSAEDQETSFVRETLFAMGGFKPFAVFDEPLDCVRVVWRDCSFTEIRLSRLLTVLEANYPMVEGESEIVGFSIKGVAHLCASHNIATSTAWKLAEVLDEILKVSPPRDRVIVRNLVRPEVQQRNLNELLVESIAA